MSDQAALMRAVVDAPADDAPRLILADWLDERGVDAAMLRRPGQLWAMNSLARVSVASVLYWRVERKRRNLFRVGELIGWRPVCSRDVAGSIIEPCHEMRVGDDGRWLCLWHTEGQKLWAVGNAIASIESHYLKRNKRRTDFEMKYGAEFELEERA